MKIGVDIGGSHVAIGIVNKDKIINKTEVEISSNIIETGVIYTSIKQDKDDEFVFTGHAKSNHFEKNTEQNRAYVEIKLLDKETRYYFTSVARSYLGNMSDEEIYEALEENKMFKSEVYNICNDLAKTLDNETPSTILEKIINRFDIYNKLILVGNVDAGIKRINY